MPRFVYVQATNPKNKVITTQLGLGVPAGYVLANTSDGSWQGVDGVTDDNSQKYVGGINSGGYPAYQGSVPADPKYPNGILS